MTVGPGGAEMSGWRAFWLRGGFWRALLMVVAYLGLYLAAGKLIGLATGGADRPGGLLGSPGNVFFELAAAILIGIVLLVIFARSIGWLPGLFARQPPAGRWWMWILPVVILAFNGLRFAAAEYSRFTAGTVLMVLFTGLCVGVAEEVLTRGLAVSLLRRAGFRELAVAALSSLLFAASHSVNLFSGQPPLVVGITVVYTFFFGVGMYLTLRVTRNLIWPILLHATTDPSGLLLSGGLDTSSGAVSGVLATLAAQANNVVILLGLILIWFIRGRISTDVDGRAVAASPAAAPEAVGGTDSASDDVAHGHRDAGDGA